MSFDLVLSGGDVWLPGGPIRTDIGVHDGVFAAFGHLTGRGAQQVDLSGLTVLPGVIDSQVHFREPGLVHKEDLETGSRSAVLGGVTTVFEMPNTTPGTTTEQHLFDKLARARGRMHCDYGFYVGATPDNAAFLDVLETLPGCVGIKIFMGSSTGSLLVEKDSVLLHILKNGSRRVVVHCEDEERLRQRWPLVADEADVSLHPVWRDEHVAYNATKRLLTQARGAKRRVHVLHVTTRSEMELLAQNRDIATVEVTPQHLTFAAPDVYEKLGTRGQMNPPIRDREHRDALWRAVSYGLVDVIGSDHAPHTLEEKAKPYPQSPSGMTGVQTLLPVMLTHVAQGRLSLTRLVDLCSAGPARVFGLARKGRIALGYDADMTIVDTKKKWTIFDKWIASRCSWTPFDGFSAIGKPVHTIVRGHFAMRDGLMGEEAHGRSVHFLESLRADVPPLKTPKLESQSTP